MAGYIEDRWVNKTVIDPKTKRKKHTDRYGKGKRYKVDGIPGVKPALFDTLKDAEKWKAKAQTRVGEGTWIDPRLGAITLREYVETVWWPALRVPPQTKSSMHPRVFLHILRHVGHLPLLRIGDEEIRAWVVQVEQDIDISTIRVTWRHFSTIMQAAVRGKRIPVNPFRDPDLRAPTAPKSKAKAWPKEVVAAVHDGLAPRYRILADEAVGAGLRQGETFGLSPADIDGDVIHVVRQVLKIRGKLAFGPPKGNKERDAPCPPELAAAISAHSEKYPPVEVTLPWVDPLRPNMPWADRPLVTVSLIVTSPNTGGVSGGALNRSTFDESQWKPALVRAGVIPPPVVEYVQLKGKKPARRAAWEMNREDGFHGLRHTFASIVLQAGETIQRLADWLGHADPAFTYRTYAHFLPESGHLAMDALDGWIGGPRPAVEQLVAPETQELLEALAAIVKGEPEPVWFRERLVAVLPGETMIQTDAPQALPTALFDLPSQGSSAGQGAGS